MRLGLYGGSFDPPHYGHILPVREARLALALDRVVYLPTARPPHKRDRRLTPARARYEMVERALAGEEGMAVSPFEMDAAAAAYTVDTVDHFRCHHPGSRIFLLIGSDSFLQLPTWRRWRRILATAELAVLGRPGWSLEEGRGELPRELREAIDGGRVHAVANAPVAASSTELRRRLAEGGEDLAALVPQAVLDYIAEHDLYPDQRLHESHT